MLVVLILVLGGYLCYHITSEQCHIGMFDLAQC